MNDVILDCNNVSKQFFDNNKLLEILHKIDLQLCSNEQVAIMGRSGSGKTTLLQLLAGLDYPTTGRISLCGKDLKNISEYEKNCLRNQKIGFIYQLHHLLPEFSALENICMPLLIRGQHFNDAKNSALSLLKDVGLSHRADFMPNKLSGGERQRVAIARALINSPVCVFADEPTGNLDQDSANEVILLINKIKKNHKTAVIMVTHDFNLTKNFDRVYQLEKGELALKNVNSIKS